ncbi:FAD-binding domain-containing protein [Lophium mytilinum]|uniref:FAD-binding domain-containing protein n=1 Tax=Lophium mytilinum TaxID=390894 RepID=A0A6A6QI53_9PEZI|nr:FAD-binding domain-containing protein [Lophium mytilinum]
MEHTLPEDTVLIAGGGPVGLILATVLSFYGVKSLLLERNDTTTKWPKMDLTNCRSMEWFRKLGLAELIRTEGVSSEIPYTVLISSGLDKTEALTSWKLPGVDQWRKTIQEKNDGTQPLEPYQRLSQALFEKIMKERCDNDPAVDVRFGWKVEGAEELEEGVKTTVTDISTGKRHIFKSRYVGACDGASSKVRRSLKMPLDGGPIPGYVLLVHFKSKDLARIRKQGQFWHLFVLQAEAGGFGGACIAQDEVDTWTCHLNFPLDVSSDGVGSEEAVYKVFGGLGGLYKIKIDEILVRSTYRPHIAVARKYVSPLGRVFLAGDAAHQNIPTGGYGMNMGIADAVDLGWKLGMVMNGTGKSGLLQAYEEDRRPVALMSVERSGVHLGVHIKVGEILGADPHIIDSITDQGRQKRKALDEHYQTHDNENKDFGVEMGYRYQSSICIPDESTPAPEFDPTAYHPSTWPGMRAPHVFLKDGRPIFDLYGKYFTLVEFADGSERGSGHVLQAAEAASTPIKHVKLDGEDHAYGVWGARLVLIRPDGHVSWRGDAVADLDAAKTIVGVITGAGQGVAKLSNGDRQPEAFTSTVGMQTQDSEFEFEKIGDMQK